MYLHTIKDSRMGTVLQPLPPACEPQWGDSVPAHNKGFKDGNSSAATASNLWASEGGTVYLHTIKDSRIGTVLQPRPQACEPQWGDSVPAHNKGFKDGNSSAATASSLWASEGGTVYGTCTHWTIQGRKTRQFSLQ